MRAIHGVSGENVLLVASRRQCLNPDCEAVKEGSIAAMKRRDVGGEAMAAARRNGPDAVDTAPESVKEALRRGDVRDCVATATVLLNGGVSFTLSDSRYGLGVYFLRPPV